MQSADLTYIYARS